MRRPLSRLSPSSTGFAPFRDRKDAAVPLPRTLLSGTMSGRVVGRFIFRSPIPVNAYFQKKCIYLQMGISAELSTRFGNLVARFHAPAQQSAAAQRKAGGRRVDMASPYRENRPDSASGPDSVSPRREISAPPARRTRGIAAPYGLDDWRITNFPRFWAR